MARFEPIEIDSVEQTVFVCNELNLVRLHMYTKCMHTVMDHISVNPTQDMLLV